MRYTLVFMALIGFLGMGAGVVGGPNASDGEMVIMDSGNSASATTSVGPNGTSWSTEIQNLNSTCRGPGDRQEIEFIGFQTDGNLTELNFRGSLNTSNPCTELEIKVNETGENSYRLEIVETSSNGICTQCLGNSEFRGSFAAEKRYKVKIIHNGEVLGTQKTPGYGEEKQRPLVEEAGVWKAFSGIFEWLGSIL